jgi:uncharacterized linocin/CFP29 family protein
MSSHLLRRHAPISGGGWERIDAEARERLRPGLGARRLVDFLGPHGWKRSATNLGRVEPIARAPEDGVDARLRATIAFVELRVPFELDREELRAGDRGAVDVDFGPLDVAAQKLAGTENAAVFHGWREAGITGVIDASPHEPLRHDGSAETVAALVASGVETLLRHGIDGPYGFALGPEMWSSVVEASERGGYPLRRHLEEITGGPTVWTPGLEHAVLVSLRGGDFLLDVGQDASVGYLSHTAERVLLYLEETLTFRVGTPEAAVALTSAAGRPRRAARRR